MSMAHVSSYALNDIRIVWTIGVKRYENTQIEKVVEMATINYS